MSFDWRDLAACVGRPELFYTDKHLYEAQLICGGCPVTGHCKAARRQYELDSNTAHPGVWAGEYWAVRNNVQMSTRARRITRVTTNGSAPNVGSGLSNRIG